MRAQNPFGFACGISEKVRAPQRARACQSLCTLGLPAPAEGARARSLRSHAERSAKAIMDEPTQHATLDSCRAGVSAAVDRAFDAMRGAIAPLAGGSDAWEEAEEGAVAALDGLLPAVMPLVSELWESCNNSMREALAKQKSAYEAKLTTARTASTLQLRNQEAQLEAHHARQLETKLASLSASLSSGGEEQAAALAEAQAQREEAQKRAEKLEALNKQIQETLRSTKALLTKSEHRAAKAETASAAREAELDSARGSLHTARSELGAAREEVAAHSKECEALREQLAALKAAHAAADERLTREKGDAMRAMAQASKEAAESQRELAEARRAAANGSVSASEELDRVTAQLQEATTANQQSEALAAELREQLAATEGDLQRLRMVPDSSASLAQSHQAEMAKLHAEHTAAVERGRAAEEDAAACRAELEAVRYDAARSRRQEPVDASELSERVEAAEAEAAQARREVQETRAALETALGDLNLQIETSKTLGEKVSALVTGIQATQAEAEERRAQCDALSEQLRGENREHAKTRTALEAAVFRGDDLEAQLTEARARLTRAESEHGQMSASAEYAAVQLARWRSEKEHLEAEIQRMQMSERAALSDADDAIEGRRKAVAQAEREAGRRRATEEALGHAEKGVRAIEADAQRHAAQAAQRISELEALKDLVSNASKQERAALVKGALRSLQQLRDHLTASLSGFRVLHAAGSATDEKFVEQLGRSHPACNPATRGHRWGVVSEDGEADTMVVKLVPPSHSPMHLGVPRGPAHGALRQGMRRGGPALPAMRNSLSAPLLNDLVGLPPSQQQLLRRLLHPPHRASTAGTHASEAWSAGRAPEQSAGPSAGLPRTPLPPHATELEQRLLPLQYEQGMHQQQYGVDPARSYSASQPTPLDGARPRPDSWGMAGMQQTNCTSSSARGACDAGGSAQAAPSLQPGATAEIMRSSGDGLASTASESGSRPAFSAMSKLQSAGKKVIASERLSKPIGDSGMFSYDPATRRWTRRKSDGQNRSRASRPRRGSSTPCSDALPAQPLTTSPSPPGSPNGHREAHTASSSSPMNTPSAVRQTAQDENQRLVDRNDTFGISAWNEAE